MERPSLKRVLCGAGLILLTLLTLLSIVTYSELDPPYRGEIRNGDTLIHNKSGIVGAYISGTLFHYVGRPASFLLVFLGILWVGLFFSNRKLEQPAMRVVGVLFLVVVVSTLFAPQFQEVRPENAPVVVVGDACAALLVGLLKYDGSLIFLLTLGFVSLLLATDMLLYNGAAYVVKHFPGWVAAAWRGFFREPGTPAEEIAKTRRRKTAEAAEEVKEKKSRKGAAKTGEEAPPEEEEEAPEEAEAPEPEPEVVKRAAVEIAEEVTPEPHFVSAEALAAEEAGAQIEIPDIGSGQGEMDDTGYELPSLEMLDDAEESDPTRHNHIIQAKARVLEQCLKEFSIAVRVVGIDTGPVVTLYELELAPGIKVGRIIGLSDDIAMALKAPNVRIVAPIPGKSTVGVEVPNIDKEFVRLSEIIEQSTGAENKYAIPLYLGKDAAGAPLVCDMTAMPHLLIAGETGSGKSVCINSIILSVLMMRAPSQVRLLLVDPKMVELSSFKDIPHLLSPVVTDMKKAAGVLEWAEARMDERYNFLSLANVRNIAAYNRLSEADLRERAGYGPDEEMDPRHVPLKLPYILIIIDELADLMMVAPKEIETSITRLAQKSRAVGIHIILATQRPSVNVITGLIKSNLPARISFRVPSKVDSRTILDQNGADKLLGKGDMLFLQPGTSKLVRAQGTFISDEEINRVVEYCKEQLHPDFSHDLIRMQQEGGDGPSGGAKDPLYDEAVRIVLESQRGSVSLLQRRLQIGYSRAARLVDYMAEDGLLGSYKGSQAREVLYTLDEWVEKVAAQGESES